MTVQMASPAASAARVFDFPTNPPREERFYLGRNSFRNLGVVWARSWESKDAEVKLYAPPAVFRALIEDGHTYAIAEFIGLVHGGEPEELEGTTDGLMEATALYQGLNRPLDANHSDDNYYIYVTSPYCSYHYRDTRYRRAGEPMYPSPIEMPLACPKPKPDGKPVVFVTYVAPLSEPRALDGEFGVQGLVERWEWVHANKDGLPIDPEVRYRRRIW